MKRTIIYVMAIVICLFSAGCSKDPIIDNEKTTEDKSVITESTPESPELALPASAKATSIKNLYSFENGIEYYSLSNNASVSDDVLRLEFVTPGLDTVTKEIVTYSLSEDKILGEVTFPEGNYITGNLDGGGFFSVSLITSEVSFYDRYCNETYKEQIYDSDFVWSHVAISSDGKYILYNRSIDGSIVLYNISTDQEDEIGDEKGTFVPIGYKDGCFYVNSYESGIFKVSPSQKKPEPVIANDIRGLITTEYMINEANSYFVITPLEDPQNRKMTLMKNENEIPSAANDKYFATLANDQNVSKMRIYNIPGSSVTPEVQVPGFVQNVIFCSQDLALIVSQDIDAEKTLYYLYDLTESTGFESILITEADDSKLNDEKIPEWTGDKEVISIAEGILDEYGVRVIYGTTEHTGIDSDYFMYTSNPIDDQEAFSKINQVKEILRYFPEGMTREVGRGQELWIYLCKDLAYADEGGAISGFASAMGKRSIIYIDVNCGDEVFKETLVHEFSHVIDYCLDHDSIIGWLNVMPENIASNAYVNSYKEVVDLTYTPFDNGNTEVWFYDSYSKTFPTEDRAVIFQKMYLSYINGKMTYDFETYENLRKKANYYCEMLRNTFDSCKNASSLPWEELFYLKLN